MQRGVVSLTSTEYSAIQSILPAETNPLLVTKLTSALQILTQQQLSETTIELSRDEADIILDSLPVPIESTPDQKSARVKLTNFIQSL